MDLTLCFPQEFAQLMPQSDTTLGMGGQVQSTDMLARGLWVLTVA